MFLLVPVKRNHIDIDDLKPLSTTSIVCFHLKLPTKTINRADMLHMPEVVP